MEKQGEQIEILLFEPICCLKSSPNVVVLLSINFIQIRPSENIGHAVVSSRRFIIEHFFIFVTFLIVCSDKAPRFNLLKKFF